MAKKKGLSGRSVPGTYNAAVKKGRVDRPGNKARQGGDRPIRGEDGYYVELSPSGELKKDTSLFWERAIFATLCVAAVLVPLVLWPSLSDVYDLPKAVLLWFGAAFLVFLLSGQFLSRKNSLSGNHRPPARHLDWAIIAALIGAATMATALSVDPATSVLGKYSRHDGLLTLAAAAVMCVAAMQVNWTQKRLTVLSVALVAAAALSALYGLLQSFGWDPVSQQYPFTAGRSAGTFGNPSLFVGYLVFNLPLAAALALRRWGSRRFLSLAYLAAFVLILSATALTFSRGGWVGAGLAAVAWVFMTRRYLMERKGVLITLVVFSVCVLGGLAVITSQWQREDLDLIERTVETARIGEGSLGVRIETWKMAAAAIADRPLFGFGPDTFGLVSPGYETKRFTELAGNVVEDNAHNHLLQLAATSGVPAALLFLTLVALMVRRGLSGTVGRAAREAGGVREARAVAAALLERRASVVALEEDEDFLKKEVDRALASQRSDEIIEATEIFTAAFVAAGLGYFLTVLSTVNPIGGSFLLWLSFGIVAVLVPGKAPREFRLPLGARIPAPVRSVALAGTAFVALSVLILGLMLLLADANYNEGSRLEGMGYLQQARERYRTAHRLNPWEGSFHRAEGRAVALSALQLQDRFLLREALRIFEYERERLPTDLNNYMFAGQAYLAAARAFGEPENLTRAAGCFKAALEIRKNYPEAWGFLAAALYDKGEYRDARQAARRAVSLYPDAQAEYYLGRIDQREGRLSAAEKHYRRASALDPSLAEARQALDDLKTATRSGGLSPANDTGVSANP